MTRHRPWHVTSIKGPHPGAYNDDSLRYCCSIDEFHLLVVLGLTASEHALHRNHASVSYLARAHSLVELSPALLTEDVHRSLGHLFPRLRHRHRSSNRFNLCKSGWYGWVEHARRLSSFAGWNTQRRYAHRYQGRNVMLTVLYTDGRLAPTCTSR